MHQYKPRRKYFGLAHQLFHIDEQYNYIVKFEDKRLKELGNREVS